MIVTLDRIEHRTATIQTFWFVPERPLRYIAGQFIELYLPHADADSRGERRWFTLYSSPTETQLSITTAFTQTTGSTFKRAFRQLHPGDKVQISEPLGDFVLPKDKTKPLVFVAAGVGMTPMRSMATWLQDTNEKRPIHMLYGAHSPEDLVDDDLFTQVFGNHFVPIISKPDAVWTGQVGHITAATILSAMPDPMSSLYYLSGPEAMMQQLADALLASNIPSHAVITDHFPGYIT